MNRFAFIFSLLIVLTACNKVVLKVDKIPENTPAGVPIYVTGNFNFWDPGDARFQLKPLSDSSYYIELPKTVGRLTYKFTRGNWSTVETNRCGNDIENHILATTNDTVYHIIECWHDLEPLHCDSVTIIVKSIPANTPNIDSIKIAGSFNAWNPGTNKDFMLKKDASNNFYFVTVPRIGWNKQSTDFFTYKFIRQNITISEADKFGREREPRILNFEKGDTVEVHIDNWTDMADPSLNYVTVILVSTPSNTPVGDKIFLTGNFNNWNPADEKYIFTKNREGKWALSIPRQKLGLSFKITRGDWWNEFADGCGNKLSNQEYNYDEIDTLFVKVENWIDRPLQKNNNMVVSISKIPENTPGGDQLFLIEHEFPFGQKPKMFPFTRTSEGHYQITFPKKSLQGSYLVCRGSHISQEVDKNGKFVIPHIFRDECSDSLSLEIVNWNDKFDPNEKTVTLQIVRTPPRTPLNEPIYLTGPFVGWNPGDKEFIFKKNEKRVWTITVPIRYLRSGFKFTRGTWSTVEGDVFGSYLENRIYLGNDDVLKCTITSWER